MIGATIVAVVLVFFVEDTSVATKVLDGFTMKLLIAVTITSVIWILTTLITKPENKNVLRTFYKLTHPGGPGWKRIIEEAKSDGEIINEKELGKSWEMPIQILLVFIGCIVIYSSLFAIGNFVYGKTLYGFILLTIAGIGTFFLFKSFNKLRAN